jgi:omega-amidase
MKIFGCQFDIVWENKPANYAKVEKLLDSADIPPDSLIVLPEMFATGFSMNVAAIHESDPSLTAEFLARIARHHQSYLIAGLVSRSPSGSGRNDAAVYSPSGKLLARYCKMHPFPLAGETDHYEPGAEITPFACGPFTVAPFICYDLRFPEIFRLAVLQNVHIFTVIANWPLKREQHWITLLRARAIENQACVIGINRCGTDPNFSYSGRSLIIDPHGDILADAGNIETIISAEVNLHSILSWRKDFPALKDMRPLPFKP